MAQFTFETVDASGAVAGQCSLALDGTGNPLIAYAGANGRLMIANRNSDTWVSEELTSAGLIGRSDSDRICLEIGSEGSLHIAYKDLESGHLVYGVKRDGQWTFNAVPTKLGRREPGGVGGYAFKLHFRRDTPELQNTPHFVFQDLSTGQLGYTRLVGGEFRMVEATPPNAEGVTSGMQPSIAFDRLSGTFAVAYVEERELDEPGEPPRAPLTFIWTKLILDPFEGTLSEATRLDDGRFSVVRPTSIAVDSRRCVAYADGTNKKLFAAVNEPGTTEIFKETVAPTVFPIVPSVAQTFHGDHRIAYADELKLKLASHNGAGEWTVELIDADGAEMPFLAYDKARPIGHIAFVVQRTLRYVRSVE